MTFSLLLLVLALVMLTLGAELLVREAVVIAEKLGVSSFFVGVTIVGFGTSTPRIQDELISLDSHTKSSCLATSPWRSMLILVLVPSSFRTTKGGTSHVATTRLAAKASLTSSGESP